MAEPWKKYQTKPGPWTRYKKPTARQYLSNVAGSANEGLLDLAGAPVDLANAALGAIGRFEPTDRSGLSPARRAFELPVELVERGIAALPDLSSEKPVGGSQFLKEAARSTQIGRDLLEQPAQDRTGRLISSIGHEIGMAALPTLGLTAKAVSMPARAMEQSIWGAFLNPIREAPLKTMAGETIAAAGAGTGRGVAKEAGAGPGMENMAALAGGFAPTALTYGPVAAAGRAVNAGRKLIGQEGKEVANRAGEEAVSKFMGETMGEPGVQQSLQEAGRLRGKMQGFDPSLGEATGSRALLAQQQRIEGQASGAALEKLAARKTGSEQAVEQFAERQAPGVRTGPEFVVDTANRRIENLRGQIGAANQRMLDERAGVAQKAARADRVGAGQSIRQGIIDRRTAMREQMDARSQAAGFNDVDLTVPFGSFRLQLLKQFSRKSRFEKDPFPGVLNEIRKMKIRDADTGQIKKLFVTFQDVKAIRERLSNEIIDALSGTNPDKTASRKLVIAKKQLDDWVQSLDQEFGTVADDWKAFRSDYYKNYIEPFESNAVFKVRQKNARGFHVTSDERVASTFFKKGDVSSAKEFKRVFGNDPEANAAIEAVALDDLRQAAIKDGVIEPRALSKWIDDHLEVLDEFPQIRAAAGDLDSANTSILARQQQLAGRARDIEDQMLVRELDAWSKGTRTPESVLEAAFKDPRKMRQLVNEILGTNPEAVEGLRRWAWDRIAAGGADQIAKQLVENRAALDVIFSPQHMQDLFDISLARAMLQRTETPTGTAYVPRPMASVERAIGQSVPQLANRVWQFRAKTMSKAYIASDTLVRGLRGRAQARADDIMEQALYDEALAGKYANMIRSPNPAPGMIKAFVDEFFKMGLPRSGGRFTAMTQPYIEELEDQ